MERIQRCRTVFLLVGVLATAIAAAAGAGAGAHPDRRSERPQFAATVTVLPAALRATMTGRSWRPGCPVTLADLRLVRARHWGFDGRTRMGRLVVHRSAAADIVTVLRRLYAARFPIRRMVPVDAYGADDYRSIGPPSTVAGSRARHAGRTTPTGPRSTSIRLRTRT